MSLPKVRIILATAVLAAGCASEPRAPLVDAELPDAWRQPGQGAVVGAWLPTFNDPHLTGLVNRAIADNHGLAQQRALLDSARQQARLVRAARLPTLNLGLADQRQRAFPSAPVNEQFDLSAVLNAPLDLWGALGDREREALLNLAAQEARYRDTELNLTAAVVSAHYDAAAALQLQELLEERLANLVQSLDVIESGYRSGLNDALDVYLARNTLEQERANVASQRQVRMQAVANLELLLADYPAGRFAAGERLPHMVAPVGAGVPAELLNRRPDIQQAWLELLAADAGLAVAHKNRFPRPEPHRQRPRQRRQSRRGAERRRAGMVRGGKPDPAPLPGRASRCPARTGEAAHRSTRTPLSRYGVPGDLAGGDGAEPNPEPGSAARGGP